MVVAIASTSSGLTSSSSSRVCAAQSIYARPIQIATRSSQIAAHRGLFAAPSRDDRLRSAAALEDLGLADLADRPFTRLSGGQRQLVLIARALAQDAPLIVLDEPTANLDYGNQLLVLEQVRRLVEAGKGIMMATHDPDHAFACGTSVLAMKDGRTAASGPVRDTLTGPVLSDLYAVAVEVVETSGGRRVCVPPVGQSRGADSA